MIETLADFLDSGDEPAAVRRALGRMAMAMGFPWLFVGRLDEIQGGAAAIPGEVETNLPAFDLYLRSGLYRRDPMAPRMMTAQRPIVMPFEPAGWGPMTEAEAEAFDAGPRHATATRLLVPTQMGTGTRWAFGFSSGERLPLQEASRLASALWLAAAVAGERLSARPASDDEPPLLGAAERDALLQLAEGLSQGAEADTLTDGERSVLLARAGRKLGARTGPEAVGKAIARRLIDP